MNPQNKNRNPLYGKNYREMTVEELEELLRLPCPADPKDPQYGQRCESWRGTQFYAQRRLKQLKGEADPYAGKEFADVTTTC